MTSKPLFTVIRNASSEVTAASNQFDLFTNVGHVTFVKEDCNAGGISDMAVGISVVVKELEPGLVPMVTGK